MPPEMDPGSPQAWLRFAKSDLALASNCPNDEVLLESLCFHAHQAAEKSVKAILIKYNKNFPKSHNLKVLLEIAAKEIKIPQAIMDAVGLTGYSVTGRYPGDWETVTQAEYAEAVGQAKLIYEWARKIIG
jgi:HEPN domain-containing protein